MKLLKIESLAKMTSLTFHETFAFIPNDLVNGTTQIL